MPFIGNLPENLVLHPIQPVPLPKNYHFSFGFVSGWQPPRKDLLALLVGEMPGALVSTQDEKGTHGFNKLLGAILGYATQYNLWGQTLPCQLVAMGADGVSYVAKSNIQSLALPTLPSSITSPLNLALGPTDSPVPVGMTAPAGRRLYYRCALNGPPQTLPKIWYVRPDNRLEDSASRRGLDRFTFWLATYAIPVKLCASVQSGEALAQRLNAQESRIVPNTGTIDAIVAAVVANMSPSVVPGLLWTASRVVVFNGMNQMAVMAMEFDGLGFRKEPLTGWVTRENKSTVWNYRTMMYSTPAQVYGFDALP
jgi:hypothetical protein